MTDHKTEVGRGSAPDSGSVPLVTGEEMDVALGRLRSKKTAPGPDGIPGHIHDPGCRPVRCRCPLPSSSREDSGSCSTSVYSKPWKEGLLCLICKEGRPLVSPTA
ncbi:jg1694 [Pararge aegeria aegeria]|uniref:Jg1694 protein n=1 Tax=Pararge aegeria aegeria TaxID=348720 RepID=A0A8S4SJ29_9NEOP|nr:jg1694 [Pararge aegeria aegeria]